VSPAVIALILHSCYRLAKLGMEDRLQWLIAAVCFMMTIVLQAEVALLFIGAGVIGILYYGNLFKHPSTPALQIAPVPLLAQIAPLASSSTLGKLLLFFLKAGSLTFGSGLVIVPFLQQGLVEQYAWLDRRRDRHDQPGTGRYHGDVRRLSGRRLLGFTGLDHRHFPAVVSAGVDCGVNSRAAWR
jgi:chromate transporter